MILQYISQNENNQHKQPVVTVTNSFLVTAQEIHFILTALQTNEHTSMSKR